LFSWKTPLFLPLLNENLFPIYVSTRRESIPFCSLDPKPESREQQGTSYSLVLGIPLGRSAAKRLLMSASFKRETPPLKGPFLFKALTSGAQFGSCTASYEVHRVRRTESNFSAVPRRVTLFFFSQPTLGPCRVSRPFSLFSLVFLKIRIFLSLSPEG